MKIATLAFAGSESTMGLTLVVNAITENMEADIRTADMLNVKECDYLLVSIYWWRDMYNLIDWLVNAGIDPRKRSPVIIIGGMAAINPRPIKKYFHYCVLGDGEKVIVSLLRALEKGEDVSGMDGVWHEDKCRLAHVDKLQARTHVDVRTNKTARVEIARGCKMNCPFCELTAIKPYRELPIEVIKHLVLTSPTKNISLFAPDTWSHSGMKEIEAYCKKLGKNNTGSDIRLDMVKKVTNASRLRFGVEGFGEATRKNFGKVRSNNRLEELLLYAMTSMKTSTGKRMAMATCYMIGDLPGEGRKEIEEFWDVLERVDSKLKEKFTLFLSVSSFAPSHFTKMERCEINPYTQFKKAFNTTRKHYKHIMIATRGAVISAPQRLCQMLTVRGDERVVPAMHYLATKGKRFLKSTANTDGRMLESIISKTGFDPKFLYRQIGSEEQLPWDNVAI